MSSDQTIDNQQYYSEILRFLQGARTEEDISSTKPWVKIHAVNYFLKEGQLFYGKRKPRKVILDDEQKNLILQQLHVDPLKGFHVGVKKMHRSLTQDYFWRFSYKSVTDFIQQCSFCRSNNGDTSAQPARVDADEIQFPWSNTMLTITTHPSRESSSPILATLYDPVSFWMSATITLQSSKNFPFELAVFLFENICNHGIVCCSTYGLDLEEFSQFENEFSQLVEKTDPTILSDDVLKFASQDCTAVPTRLKETIESYFEQHPTDWMSKPALLAWLWKLRNAVSNGTSPMEMMANQRSMATRTSYPKVPVKRKKLVGIFRCQVCGETFSTAVLLRHHESSHLEERQTRSSCSRHLTAPSSNNQSSSIPTEIDEGDGTSNLAAIEAVRTLIAQTKQGRLSKEDRGKRGEYRRYSPEIREAIVQHALRYGSHEAARTFTSSLGFKVSYSTVRNFVQTYQSFTTQMKEEIGRYAAECGIDAAQKHYSAKLNKTISAALIRKFRRMYHRMVLVSQSPSHSGLQRTRASGTPGGRHVFCASVREEIGKFATEHGIQAAVRHFSDQLQLPVKESTVRKFKKTFVSHSSRTSAAVPPPPTPPPLPVPSPPPPSGPTQQESISDSNYFHQSIQYGHFHPPAPQYVYHQPVNGYQNHTNSSNMYTMSQPPVPPYPSYSALPPPPQYQPSAQLPSYPGPMPSRSTWTDENPSNDILTPLPPPPPLQLMPSLESAVCNPHSMQAPVPPKPNKKKKSRSVVHRGSYATYSPQFRLEVGRYATNHSCQETAQHFKEKIGHEIPESTVRGLRDRYLAQLNKNGNAESNSNSGPRGRPLRLGRYDSVVQECLRELKRSGERVNAFVAIATARQVLLQKEPSLLSENGGSVTLTNNWAKSFLKRMGINKEQSQSEQLSASSAQTES